jgi:hypothetical protein
MPDFLLIAFAGLAALFVLIVVVLLAAGFRPRRASRALRDGGSRSSQGMNSSSSSL